MSEEGGFPDLSGILARVTENPQAMAMLSSLLGGGAPSSAKEHEPPPLPKEEEVTASVPARMPKPHKDGKADARRRLLIALKPFLSKERRQALESVLIVLDAISLLPRGKEPPCT